MEHKSSQYLKLGYTLMQSRKKRFKFFFMLSFLNVILLVDKRQ